MLLNFSCVSFTCSKTPFWSSLQELIRRESREKDKQINKLALAWQYASTAGVIATCQNSRHPKASQNTFFTKTCSTSSWRLGVGSRKPTPNTPPLLSAHPCLTYTQTFLWGKVHESLLLSPQLPLLVACICFLHLSRPRPFGVRTSTSRQ